MMHHFDPKLKTFIEVDLSINGISAMLLQGTEEERQVVSVASRTTSQVESRYAQIDLASLEVDYALRRFRFYIAGGPRITIITDHKPLVSIFKNI